MWSVNTWLIVVCVAVFVLDGLAPTAMWKPVEVRRNVPPAIGILGGAQYRVVPRGDETRSVFFERDVFDASTAPPTHIGTLQYEWMTPLKRWLHFSTDRAFRALQVWRFIGFQFLHANLMHLVFNMIALFFFGPMVEEYLGRKRYLAFYLLCGIFGAIMYLLLNLGGYVAALMVGQGVQVPGLLFNSTVTPLVGASAGVFGVLMAGAFLAPNATVLVFFILPLRLRTLAYVLVAVALVTVLTGGHNAGGEAGHLGGALAGFYFIRRPQHLHGFFDVLGRIDPTSHHYRDRRSPRSLEQHRPGRDEIDRILEKVHSRGLSSLTEREKHVLRAASERGE